MDPLEIKSETAEFVVNVFHNFDKIENRNQNEENESDPLEVKIEPSELNDDFQYFRENGIEHENLENGDFSSEQTLNSVS